LTHEEDVVNFSWDSLIAPIEAESFERDYFSRKPLHLKARDLPSCGLESIDGWRSMLKGQQARPQGRRVLVDLDPSVDASGALSPELDTLLDQGGPLIVNSVHEVNPVIEAIANAVSSGLGGRSFANGYISPKGKDALDLHADDHEVVVLQLHGVKNWTIGTKVARGYVKSSLFAIDHASIIEHARRTDTFQTLELHPGDVLYLPRGLVHRATARDESSLHVSIGVFHPIGLDFDQFVLNRLIAENASRDYLPNLRFDEGAAKNRAYMDLAADRFATLARSEDLRRDFLNLCRKKARISPEE
jgi:ribosomal protein L16 Arg81 hydroxylase